MPTLILDPIVEAELIADRRACRRDRYDEVWNGIYVIVPPADNEHHELAGKLSCAITNAFGSQSDVDILAGANVSDQEGDWTQNYRCPDVVVTFPGSLAVDRDTHFFGGPDFLTEIISPHDRSRDKLDFYAAIGVRELLLIDRNPWGLELYALQGAELKLIASGTPENGKLLASGVLRLQFRLLARKTGRPQIEVQNLAGPGRWIV
ncbi:MAG: Uma2 family endonuclease [Pirellulaceae bacterium]|nr:Uma2 family endonuclease [Pirellulaceae bacterium]